MRLACAARRRKISVNTATQQNHAAATMAGHVKAGSGTTRGMAATRCGKRVAIGDVTGGKFLEFANMGCSATCSRAAPEWIMRA